MIEEAFRGKVTDFHQPWLSVPEMVRFRDAVRRKISIDAPFEGPCPWGFVDGTVQKICRPGVNQRLVFNGHKRSHALVWQSLVTPNGLIANLFGPLPGRRHDAGMLRESGLLGHLEAECNFNGRPLPIYGDKGYPFRPHLMRPFPGRQLTEDQVRKNYIMSTVRQSVEWNFGKLKRQWAFLDFEKNHKLHLSPVGKLFRVGVILMNCNCCLYGNQTSKHFGIDPPTLEEYLA